MHDHLDDIIRDTSPTEPDEPDEPDEPSAAPASPVPVGAAEEDPDAAVTATLPGYSAAGAGEGHVGPASSDRR